VKALAKAIEVKDPYTHGHSERVTEYALMIADAMRLDERERQKLKYAATLHDIGKIGIAGRVLNKPGDLTDEEYTHVKTHPLLGESIVEPVEFLQGPRPIILHHHERFDGRGYPGGLKGTDIPLCARILSVADAFEAMRSDRPYRRAMPLNNAVEELKRNAGTQFDPRVVEVFLGILERCGGDPIKR
jgi:HD-GYP domain-containing protein (c-di-GMP phosphodiesterase class II)